MKVVKSVGGWIFAAILLILLFNIFQANEHHQKGALTPFSDLIHETENGRVADAVIQGRYISGHYSDGKQFSTFIPDDAGQISTYFIKKGIRVSAAPIDATPNFWSILVAWFPMILLMGAWYYFFSMMKRVVIPLESIAASLAEISKKRE